MKAVVLVGGEGTRLRPLTLTIPKQMLPIGRRPMIERVLENLARHGIDEAVLSLGYRPDAFIEAYPDSRCAGVTLSYAVEAEPLDTAGAVRFAALDAGLDETFVVVNGDVITDLDVSELVDFHRDRAAGMTIALTPVDDPSAFGVVSTDESGRVVAFVEKPSADEAPSNLINAGTYVVEPSVLGRIPGGKRVSIERETFPALVAEGCLYALASEANWLDAGTPAAYLEANLGYVADPDGSCRLGDGAVVKESVVGSKVSFGPGSWVENSVLLNCASVGEGAEVCSSIVGPGATIGARSVVASLSVIGEGFAVEPGARLAGQRLPSTP
jgi:mannose-1-phosphate guanylyltransferase